MRWAPALLVVALLAAWPSAARASDVSVSEFRTLVEEAADSPDALDELRQVDAVDGRPMDVEGALEGVRGEELDARLATLWVSVSEASGSGDPSADARDVLEQSRFHGESVPGPFRGFIERVGEAVPDLDWLDDLIPGGRWVVYLGGALLIALIVWVLAKGILSRRIRESAAEARAAAAEAAADPKALERQAAEAEQAGDLETALRLRFRAGLLRLDERGAIYFRPSISTHEVRRALRSEQFNGLASTFDDVVYGGREAQGDDVADARQRWPEVVSSAKRRD